MKAKPETIDEYLATVSATQRTALEKLRKTIVRSFREGYGGTKSALHFDPEAGLPSTLVRKLVKARIAEAK